MEDFREIVNVLIADIWNGKKINETGIEEHGGPGPAEVGDHKFIM